MMFDILLTVSLFLGYICGYTDAGDIVLQLKDGKVQGKQLVTADENQFPYIAFQGIPFAEPPVGENRFQPPQPKQPWSDIWNATEDVPMCLQPDVRPNIPVSEDCLYLNVYTPNVNGSYPVMFWIFGGAFIIGSDRKDAYGPDYLIQEDVVIVAPNYRIGIFGFLSTEDDVVPGNNGIKDQILALQWVRENIRAFGGNPNDVTIFGESAGSVCVSLLLQAKPANGLYHAAIMESGVSLSPFSLLRNPRSVAFTVAKSLNITVNTSEDLVAELRKMDADKLLASSVVGFLSVTALTNPLNGLAFAPTMEPPSEEAVLSQKSYEQLRKGDFNRVPIMVGFNSAEGNAFQRIAVEVPLFILKYDLNPQLLIPEDMNVNKSSAREVASIIKKRYFGTKSIKSQPVALSTFITDDQFIKPTNEFVRLISNYTTTYYYEFSYVGDLPGFIRSLPGVAHSEELYYLWRVGDQNIAKEDLPVRLRMVQLWSNFAKYKNPTPKEDEILDNVIWKPANSIDFPYLHINLTLEARTNPREQEVKFWSSLYETYGNPPYDTY